MTLNLIGLTGLAGSGKDEAAKALVAQGWKRDAFADRMRTALLALNPIIAFDVERYGPETGECIVMERLAVIVERLGWDRAKREYDEVRRLLQKFGTEAGREIHGEDCWVDALFADWDALRSPLVVTDVRFNNEANAIRARGGKVVRITRPGVEPLPGNHASEAGVSASFIDYEISNVGTIAQLHEATLRAAGVKPMKLARLYLSGPMTGVAEHNAPAFNAAAAKLRALGHEVFNPAEHGFEAMPWADYLRRDLAELLGLDALAMLPGWTASRGAQLEVHVAKSLGMPVLPVEHWLREGDR